jgi:hypothetical protein
MKILDLWKRTGLLRAHFLDLAHSKGLSNRLKSFGSRWLDYLAFCPLSSRVFSANMGGKSFVALPLVITLHFRERVASGRPLRIEHPCAFGATAALKIRLFDPYQRAERDDLGRLARRA